MPMSLPTVRYLSSIGSGETGPSDADLLGRFVDRRDEVAFAHLVRRHEAMVYGVCRRLLPTDQDAEDAFQATFLVLAEKAQKIAPREAVGNWLFGVSRRAALLARRTIARRSKRMTPLTELPAPPPDPMEELRQALDQEVSRLADIHRTVIVLCDLEGRSRKEAAAILGWPEGTVAGRLVQARRLLAKRLVRHAPAIPIAAVLAGTASRAPAAVLALIPLGERVVPASILSLTRAVLANLVGGKLMKTMIAVLVLGCAGFGMTIAAGLDKREGTQPAPDATAKALEEKPAKDQFVVWGKEVDGLQAGLSLIETRSVPVGKTVRLEVQLEVNIRNIGKEPIKITYGAPHETEPTVTDAAGKKVWVTMPPFLDPIVIPVEKVIEPGKSFTLFQPKIIVEADAKQPLPKNVAVPTIRIGSGTFVISYSGMVNSHEKLATGELPLKDMGGEADLPNGRVSDKKVDNGPRTTSERYVAAALTGKTDEAADLAVKGASPQSPSKKEWIGEFAKLLDAKTVRFPTAYVAADAALVVSEAVKLVMAQPDGTNNGLLVFAVVKSDGRWLVRDIDFRTEESLKAQVESFRKKHPEATLVPDTASATRKEAVEASAKRIKALQEERITTLNDVFRFTLALAKAGKGEFREALDARMTLLEAELAVAEKETDRVALYKKTLESLKELEQLAQARKAAAQGTELDVLKAKAKRLEVEIALAKYQ